jgi:hypothetical protein
MKSLSRITLQLQLGSALVCGSVALQQFGYGSDQEGDAIFESAQEAPSLSAVDTVLGKRFADAAWHGRLGYSVGQCYAYVWSALRAVLGSRIESLSVPASSAYMFGDWVDNNPASAKQALRLVKVKGSGVSAPEGSVLVWEPGQCGYNGVHGHIEIALGDGTACSDFCGPIARGCGEPRIYAPFR